MLRTQRCRTEGKPDLSAPSLRLSSCDGSEVWGIKPIIQVGLDLILTVVGSSCLTFFL